MDRIRFLQYIGARYVPKFYVNSQNPDSSEWEANVDYEYMTWVSLPNGAMYLSKEDVPASVGSPASNPRYWMTAGQFNAYIQQLQTEINDMQDGSVQGSLQYQINYMNDGSAVGSLQAQISSNDLDITELYRRTGVNTLRLDAIAPINRRIINVGDSYGTRTGEQNYSLNLKSLFGLSNDDYYNFSEDSMGFESISSVNGYTALQCLQANAANVTDHDTITDIIVTVGVNDARNTYYANIPTYIRAFIAYCKTEFPNAKIHYGFIGNITGSTDSKNAVLDYYKLIALNYDEFEDAGCDVMRGVECVMHDANNLISDWIHPSNSGGKEMARFIYEHITQGKSEYRKSYHWTNNDGAELLINFIGDEVSINIMNVETAKRSGNLMNTINLIDLTGSPIRGTYNVAFWFAMNFHAVVGSVGQYVAKPCHFESSLLKVYDTSNYSYDSVGVATITLPTIQV